MSFASIRIPYLPSVPDTPEPLPHFRVNMSISHKNIGPKSKYLFCVLRPNNLRRLVGTPSEVNRKLIDEPHAGQRLPVSRQISIKTERSLQKKKKSIEKIVFDKRTP